MRAVFRLRMTRLAVFAFASMAIAAAASLCGSNPPLWPDQFMLVQRKVVDPGAEGGPNVNATTVTHYDWQRRVNLIQISPDGNNSDVLHDLELGTGKSFYFTPTRRACTPVNFSVGILRPDWLSNATYLGVVRPAAIGRRRAALHGRFVHVHWFVDLHRSDGQIRRSAPAGQCVCAAYLLQCGMADGVMVGITRVHVG